MNRTSGVVVLCPGPIIDSCKGAGQPGGPELLGKFFTDVLAHEHFHAIFEEGMPRTGVVAPARSEAAALEEALAEWVELDLFRDDPQASAWIIEHATSGAYPTWPYAGALWLEVEARKNGTGTISTIIQEYRSDPLACCEALRRRRVLP
ncbi:MAG: hypothetical protein HY815_12435 [Candidatus Riflebacteria bacterium]|nr:hypothetical protein [Candidatus Riflebacteria bacterium]